MVEPIPKERWGEIPLDEWNETEWPQDAEMFGIIEDGKIAAWYLVEKNRTHVGPFRANRKGYLGGLLIHHASENNPEMYVAATTEDAVAMCEKMGLTEIAGRLFTR